MVKLFNSKGVFLLKNSQILEDRGTSSTAEAAKLISDAGKAPQSTEDLDRSRAAGNTIASSILSAHDRGGKREKLALKFDALASHDITYVGIIQTARASGLKEFPVPYALTNCHNSLCAVGGTINEDDHAFGLSAARKYGGIFVPAHQAVIHQYAREMLAKGGAMILGSDSHTRYGALGTMGIGEGGPELVKQLVGEYYEIPYPRVVAIYLKGKPRPGVGPQDVALAIIRKVFPTDYVKNSVMEFVGPGVSELSVDFRNGIDVMTTETACLSSIWKTDDKVKEYYRLHGRESDFRELAPGDVAWYDGCVEVDLSTIEPMIALPFHPSNAFTISELKQNAEDIFAGTEKEIRKQFGDSGLELPLRNKIRRNGILMDQGVVAGCSGGTFENLAAMADILTAAPASLNDFPLTVYPASQPVNLSLTESGIISRLMAAGVLVQSAFCGPCFGACDTPSNGALSIRHTTRNFVNREGSKPGDGQLSAVALMDARSIAATFAKGGLLTAATELEWKESELPAYRFHGEVYERKVYQGFGKADHPVQLVMGPNIVDWPKADPLPENLLLRFASILTDPVTTTDELIPSGETSSYRSNPPRLSEFTLSRKDPSYVGRAKAVRSLYDSLKQAVAEGGEIPGELSALFARIGKIMGEKNTALRTGVGSVIYARKPGDGSAREQAASCQKVLGGWANIAVEYATKRYRSNLINWGIIPFQFKDGEIPFSADAWIFLPGVAEAIRTRKEELRGWLISADSVQEVRLLMPALTDKEIMIILAGNLMNYYAEGATSPSVR